MEKGYGDIALDIIQEMVEQGDTVQGASPDPSVPDLRRIDDSAIDNLLSETTDTEVVEEEVVEDKETVELTSDSNIKDLIAAVSNLQEQMNRIENLLTETTSVGAIGVNQAGPAKRKRKSDPSTYGLARRGTFGTPLNPEARKKFEKEERAKDKKAHHRKRQKYYKSEREKRKKELNEGIQNLIVRIKSKR